MNQHLRCDALLMSGEFLVQGRDALEAHFRGYLQRLGAMKVDSVDTFIETSDSIDFEATVTTDLGQVRVFDGWVLRGGKIAYHFTGVK